MGMGMDIGKGMIMDLNMKMDIKKDKIFLVSMTLRCLNGMFSLFSGSELSMRWRRGDGLNEVNDEIKRQSFDKFVAMCAIKKM